VISSTAALVYVIIAILLFLNLYSCPNSSLKRANTFTSVLVFPEPAPAKRKKLREAGFKDNVVFTTYTILHELVGQEFDFVIFDEAHTLAHKETKAFKNAQKMLKSLPGVPLLLLSGTPILHKPRDLWALIHLIDPQMAGDFHTWTKRYEKVVQTIVKKIPIKSKISDPIIRLHLQFSITSPKRRFKSAVLVLSRLIKKLCSTFLRKLLATIRSLESLRRLRI
jgi:SNF2 family DNA or RNA helicase